MWRRVTVLWIKWSIWLQFLFYSSSRQDIWPLEVFSGLYKCAAILHFSVSTVPAKLVQIGYRGSGRRRPADARPQVFLDFFHFWVVFTLREPSGRTFCVDKGRLQHSNYQFYSVFPHFLSGSSWMPAGMETVVVCGPARDDAAAANEPAAFTADIWDLPAAA